MKSAGAWRTTAFSFVDQGFIALANFITTVAIARYFASAELAGYGLGVGISMVIQALLRSYYMIDFMLLSRRAAVRIGGGYLAQHMLALIALLAGAAIFFAAAKLQAGAEMSATGTAVLCMAPVGLQLDFGRSFLLKQGRLFLALSLSMAYLGMLVALSALASYGMLSFNYFMLSLLMFCMANLMACLFVTRPRWKLGWRLIVRSTKTRAGWSILNSLGHTGANHAPLLILGAVSAPVHVGAFVAMRSILQPMALIMRSLDLIDKNGYAQLSKVKGAGPIFFATLAKYVSVGLLISLPVIAFPSWIIELIYGPKFAPFASSLDLWVGVSVLSMLIAPLDSVAFSHGLVGAVAKWRLVAAALAIATAGLLCEPLGDKGAVTACLVGNGVGLVGGIWAARSILWGVSRSGP